MTPAEEVLATLDDLVRAGKIRYVGVLELLGLAPDEVARDRRPLRLPALRRAPGLLLADRPRLRVGADAARARSEASARWSGARSAGAASPARSAAAAAAHGRAACTRSADDGPPVDDEYLYRGRRRARRGREGDGQDDSADRAQLAAAAADGLDRRHRRAQRGAAAARTSAPSAGTSRAEQIAKLDAASATTLAYPYWHQRSFAERNPPPV